MLCDPIRESKPLETGFGQNERIALAVGQLSQPGLDVATDWRHLQVGPDVKDLSLAAKAARADLRAGWERLKQRFRIAADECIAGRFARRHGGERQARDFVRRQILQAVNGDVDPPVE